LSAPVTGTLEVTGTWTANADGTYSDSTTTTGNVQIHLPCTCLEIEGTCSSCSWMGNPVAIFAGYASATCEEDPNADTAGCDCSSGCICSATIDQAGGIGVPAPQGSSEAPAFPSTGDYTIEDSTFTLRADDHEYSYCASETALTMTPARTDWTGTLTGAIKLQRQ
jgi:hypothetical protein